MIGMPDAAALDTQGVPAILPNPGGSLPSDRFAGVSGLPTARVPHSGPVRLQHAPNERPPGSVAREGARDHDRRRLLDLGAPPPHVR